VTTVVLIFPAIIPTVGDHEFAARTFANRSAFPSTTRLVASVDLTAGRFVNLSIFGHVRVTTGVDLDLIPTPFANVSAFGAAELAAAGADVNLRPATFANVSTFGAPEIAEAPADVNLRPTPVINVSTFGDAVLSPEEGGGGDDEITDGDDMMIAGNMIGGGPI
jgi:hypothetical protein